MSVENRTDRLVLEQVIKKNKRLLGIQRATRLPFLDIQHSLQRLKSAGAVRYLLCAGWEINYEKTHHVQV